MALKNWADLTQQGKVNRLLKAFDNTDTIAWADKARTFSIMSTVKTHLAQAMDRIRTEEPGAIVAQLSERKALVLH